MCKADYKERINEIISRHNNDSKKIISIIQEVQKSTIICLKKHWFI